MSKDTNWSADDAVMDALLEVRSSDVGSGGSLPSHPQGLAALAPTDRHHARRRPSAFGRHTRETILLAVGGMVLGAIGLLLGFGVFSLGGEADDGGPVAANKGEWHGNPSLASGTDATNRLTGESDDAEAEFRNVVSTSSDSLNLHSFDARLLHENLRDLRVQGHGITDESLAAIAEKCPNLLGLTLFNTDITDEGFAKHIGTFQQLRRLSLSHSRRITDKGISGLLAARPDDFRKPDDQLTLVPVLKHLEELDLSGFVGQTAVGPEGLPEGYVDPYSKFTDAGLLAISPALANVNVLNLNGTKFTDHGVRTTLLNLQEAFQASKGETIQRTKINWLDLGNSKLTAAAAEIFLKDRMMPDLLGINWIGSRLAVEEVKTVAENPRLRRLHFGGNGFVPMELDPRELHSLAKAKELRELKLSWISCPKGTDWAPLGELTQLESLTLDSIRGQGNETILAAVAKLTNLKRLELTNISGLAPMTRRPMDASEYASDNPVRQLKALSKLQYLDFSRSSHILDSALHLLHDGLPRCRIFAADGFEIQPGIARVVVSAGRENLEGGVAVAWIDGSGVVADAGRQRTMWFNDLHNGLFPKDFKLTSGVRSPVELKQPCYDSSPLHPETYRTIAMVPSSPAGHSDSVVIHGPMDRSEPPPPADIIRERMSSAIITLPAYDMKRWPKKEIWGSRTPDFAVRINDSKTKGMAAAIAISTGPIEDWILKGPGSQPGDGAHKAGAVMAVLKPIPDPRGDDGQFTHHADCEIPQGKHWLIVLCPGHKPHQREFTFEGKPIDLVIDMDEAAKPAPANSTGD